MMLSTQKEERFPINGTTTKLTIFIKNLIQTIDAKIVNKPESMEWEHFKLAGLADVTDRIAFHTCVMGNDPPSGEPLQTSLKRIIKELVKKVPCVEEYFHFQNLDNLNRSASFSATRKIVNKSEVPNKLTPPQSDNKETTTTSDWETIPTGKGNRMATRQSQKDVDNKTHHTSNSYENLTDSNKTGQDSDDSTIMETLYDQFEEENKKSNDTKSDNVSENVEPKSNSVTTKTAWDKTINILSKNEYDTIEKVIQKGKTDTLDLDILCKWIMHKNVDIFNACGKIDSKVGNWNQTITSNVKKDQKTILKASTLAMQTFTDHVKVETKESTATMGHLKLEMENIEMRTKRNLLDHSKAVDKLKSEVKKQKMREYLQSTHYPTQRLLKSRVILPMQRN